MDKLPKMCVLHILYLSKSRINVTLWLEMVDLIVYKVILFQKQLKSGFASFV